MYEDFLESLGRGYGNCLEEGGSIFLESFKNVAEHLSLDVLYHLTRFGKELASGFREKCLISP